MLGWEVFVYRPTTPDVFIARWSTNISGLNWLDQLVREHKALEICRHGYPDKYAVAAGVLLPIIQAGLPANKSPLVIGDDYVLPQGWSGDITWNQQEVLDCHRNDQLIVEAWDQS